MLTGKRMGIKIDYSLRRWLNHIEKLRREDQTTAIRPWEKLDKDIMETIAVQLNLKDYISCSFVCKSWRSLLLQSDILRPQVPWLLLPHLPSSHDIKFLNFLEEKCYTFALPKGVDRGKVVGCSKGWVVFMTKPTFKISLFNPIFGVQYDLPLLPTASYLQRVELSSPNISDCTVVAIFDSFGKLALCKFRDEKWEVLSIASGDFGRADSTLIDALFCSHKLYVLIKSEFGNGTIENLIVKLPNCGEDISMALIHDLDYKNNNDDLVEVNGMPPSSGFNVFLRHLHISYLAESTKGRALLIQKHHCLFCVVRSEQVNMIHKYFDIVNHDDENSDNDEIEEEEEEEEEDAIDPNEEEVIVMAFKHILSNLDGFKVYEIEDLARNKRVCKGLGKEEGLFLSSKSRVCLPSNACNRVQGNCIYFLTDHPKLADSHGTYLIGMNGIYNLEDLTVTSFVPELQYYWNIPKLMWFAPNLIQ